MGNQILQTSIIEISQYIENYLIINGFSKKIALLVQNIAILFAVITVALLLGYLGKLFIKYIIPKMVHKTKNKWDNFLLERKFFRNLVWFIPVIIIYLSASYFHPAILSSFIQKTSIIILILLVLISIQKVLLALNDTYNTFHVSKSIPIKSYIQLVIILSYLIGGIIIISFVLNKSPLSLLSTLGAFVAIIILIFKDSILGFVASIQLTANDMVAEGDWITIPSKMIDGIVTDLNLTTIKVQNWDKTIVSIPTYSLVSESFTNWKGMETSGGRRIKKHFYIDISTIKFINDSELDYYKSIKILEKYITEKQNEYKEFNMSQNNIVNEKKLTNIGLFRIYIKGYLKEHSSVNQDMTSMVRQLQSTEKGVPIEIYTFLSEKRWTEFECIQSDILDHIFAIIPEFKLKTFQNISGEISGLNRNI